jgi:hypothetical protein
MGQPKLRPDAALRGKFPAGVLENPEPIAERFAHSTDSRPAALRPAQPPPQRPATPVASTEAPPAGFARVRARWSANRRLLIVASILALLVPAVIFAAVWLSLGDPAEPPAPAPPQEAESKPPAAVLTSAGRIEAIGGSGVAFPIALDGTDGVPSRSVIAIKGLPHGSNVSEGRPYGDSEWTLRPDQIGDLSLTMPAAAQGEFKLAIALIAPDDRVIAETETLLVVQSAPAAPPAPAGPEVENALTPRGGVAAQAALVPEDSEATAAIPDQQATEATAADPDADASDGSAEPLEEKPIMMETASVPSRAAPPDQDEPADASTNALGRVQPSVFVNMREAPSSSSPVLGVIAKGTELPVLDRKRGWVQVAHPETAKQGWIYSGLLVGETKTNHRVRRVAPAESEPKSESFWGRLGRWLSPSPEQSNPN